MPTTGQLPYSIHSFMLPFRWDYLPKGFSFDKGREQFNFEQRTDLQMFLRCLLGSGSHWQRKFYRINGKKEKYNEFHYFHPYASRTIFDLQQHGEPESTDVHANKVMLYFEYRTDPETDEYIITYRKKQELADSSTNNQYVLQKYHLKIRNISLHVYNTGIGILTINLENYNYDQQGDIFKINELGRKLYPRYLTNDIPATKEIEEGELAQSIELLVMGAGMMTEDYSDYMNVHDREVYHYEKGEYVQSWVTRLPAHIRGLFNRQFRFNTGSWEADTVGVSSITDYRMFFLCWHRDVTFSEDLRQTEHSCFDPFICKRKNRYNNKWYSYPYEDNTVWYKYLIGDNLDKSIATVNQKEMHHWIKKSTYARWVGDGTLLGITLNSFVAISKQRDITSKSFIQPYMKTVYYQMAILCLAQRSSVLRFSAEITDLSDLARSNENKKLVANIKILYKNYIEFINKIYYREITGHFSGIELYNKFHEVMKLNDEVKTLDDELNDLFNYIRLEEQEKQGDEAHRLNIVASWFLPASFVAALFGISFSDIKTLFTWHPAFDWLLIIGVGYLISFLILKVIKK